MPIPAATATSPAAAAASGRRGSPRRISKWEGGAASVGWACGCPAGCPAAASGAAAAGSDAGGAAPGPGCEPGSGPGGEGAAAPAVGAGGCGALSSAPPRLPRHPRHRGRGRLILLATGRSLAHRGPGISAANRIHWLTDQSINGGAGSKRSGARSEAPA